MPLGLCLHVLYAIHVIAYFDSVYDSELCAQSLALRSLSATMSMNIFGAEVRFQDP